MNLIVNSSPKTHPRSVGGALADRLARRLGGTAKTIRIYDSEQSYFNYEFREDWIDLFSRAERLIIPVAMWNFTVPAALKDFIDKIAKQGRLWEITKEGKFKGLLKDRPVYIIMTSGGHYPSGAAYDFVAPYLKAVLSSFGIHDVKVFRLGGVEGSEDLVKNKTFIEEKTAAMFKAFGL